MFVDLIAQHVGQWTIDFRRLRVDNLARRKDNLDFGKSTFTILAIFLKLTHN